MSLPDFWQQARHEAASVFLKTGAIGTVFGGNKCFGSNQCASGWACVQGVCKPLLSNSGSYSSGCGGTTGGGAGGGCASAGSAVFDGCTISGCGGCASDCPGIRSCRYDAYGTVNCFCGEVKDQGCSSFCTSYTQSTGETADGCSGLACDECSYCDYSFVSASGSCKKKTDCSAPCHCSQNCVPDCYTCNQAGEMVPAPENCKQCYTVYKDCSCTRVTKTCCYSLAEAQVGLSGYTRCLNSINCANACPDSPAPEDPCRGECTSEIAYYDLGTCVAASPPPPEPGYYHVKTGCIQATGVGKVAVLYDKCNTSKVPDKCKEAECSCNSDCKYPEQCIQGTCS